MSRLSRREMIRQINIVDNEGGGPGSVSGVVDSDRMKELDLDEIRQIYLEMFDEEAKAKTKKPKPKKKNGIFTDDYRIRVKLT